MAYFITASASASVEIQFLSASVVASQSVVADNDPVNLDSVVTIKKGNSEFPNQSRPVYKDSVLFTDCHGNSTNWIYDNTSSRDTDFNLIKTLNTNYDPSGGGSTSPGGSDTNIQYNKGGSFDGASTFNFISSSNTVEITGSLVMSGSGVGLNVLGDITASGEVKIDKRLLSTSSLSSAGNVSGDVLKLGNNTTVAGLIYALTGSKGTANGWVLASSGSGVLATSSLAIALGTNSTNDGMLLRGVVNVGHDPGSATAIGGPLYLADGGSSSYLSTTTTNHIARVVGHYYDTNIINFNPSNDWIVRS